MEKYKSIENQFYINIAGQIDFQVKANPEIREFKFKKIPETQSEYYACVLQRKKIPPIGDYDFIVVAPRKELGNILNDELRELGEDSLPQVIRVIHSNLKKDSWSILFEK